jgi:recombinational DNA repair protein (RecF pathway)
MKEESKTKVCKCCGEEKSLSDFYTYNGRTNTICKQCYIDKRKKYVKANRDKVNKANRERYAKNPNTDSQNRWNQRNKDKVREASKRHYERNIEAMKEYQRLYYQKKKSANGGADVNPPK